MTREIRFNMSYLQAHKLNQSTKWLGELLTAVRKGPTDLMGAEEADTTLLIKASQVELADSLHSNELVDSQHAFNKVFFEQPSSALDSLNLARVLFDNHEFKKCSFILKPFCV